MSATRLARGLFAFQLPVLLMVLVGIPWLGLREPWWLYVICAPASVVLLLGSLVTWGLEALRPLPADRNGRRMLRYQLPTFIFASLPMAGYAFLGGAFFRTEFDWNGALLVLAMCLTGYGFLVAIPLFALGLRGVLTPKART